MCSLKTSSASGSTRSDAACSRVALRSVLGVVTPRSWNIMPSPPHPGFRASLLRFLVTTPPGVRSLGVRSATRGMRKEIDPESFSKDDPTGGRRRPRRPTGRARSSSPRRPSATPPRTMLIAARLTEALVKVHGFAGLRDGLRLLRHAGRAMLGPAAPGDRGGRRPGDPGRAIQLAGRQGRGARFPGQLAAGTDDGPGAEAVRLAALEGLAGGQEQDHRADIERAIQISPREAARTGRGPERELARSSRAWSRS